MACKRCLMGFSTKAATAAVRETRYYSHSAYRISLPSEMYLLPGQSYLLMHAFTTVVDAKVSHAFFFPQGQTQQLHACTSRLPLKEDTYCPFA